MADIDKLNIDSIIQRLLEGKIEDVSVWNVHKLDKIFKIFG